MLDPVVPTVAPTATPAPAPSPTPSPAPSSEASTSSILTAPTTPLPEWKEFTPDAAKTPEENAAAKATHDAAKPAPIAEPAPLKVEDFVLPEGAEASPELLGKLAGLMNDAKLSPKDRANALIALQQETMQAAFARGSAQQETERQAGIVEIKKDPDLPTAIANIGSLIKEHGSQELKDVFDTGVGDNPHVYSFLKKVGAQVVSQASKIITLEAKIAELTGEPAPLNGNPPGAKAKSFDEGGIYTHPTSQPGAH